MKITAIETIPIRLPTRRAHRWASLTTPIGVYVIVKLHTDEGLIGLGEAPVLKDWGGDHGRYFGETPQTTVHVIGDILAPALKDRDPRRIETVHRAMDAAVKGYPYAKAAVDMAVYDVVGKALNVPAYQLLGGCFRDRVPIAHSLGLMETETAIEEALQVKAEGVKTIKLKGGVDPKRDVDLVRRMREALGPEIKICVDANQGYATPKLAVGVIAAMEEWDLFYMEQPVEGVDAMAEVARRVKTPIMADESAWTPEDVVEIGNKRAADLISIYTTKPGGLFKAKKVAAIAEALALPCNVNGSVETGVGNAANLHLAASTGVVELGCVLPVSAPREKKRDGLAGRYYEDDIVVEPFPFDAGDILIWHRPGLGVELDEDKLRHYRLA
ncbi:MAG TPA: enolase C-terminal domain-like protein [candidate division Zixibacteria bacterium]|nr:enolase C-terminal domain-like protein [candidate division Zixibacteria bacterium]